MCGRSALAAGVSRTPRPSRISSSVPMMLLARAMPRLTVDCGSPSSSAVSVMCWVRPSSASRGSSGKQLDQLFVFHVHGPSPVRSVFAISSI